MVSFSKTAEVKVPNSTIGHDQFLRSVTNFSAMENYRCVFVQRPLHNAPKRSMAARASGLRLDADPVTAAAKGSSDVWSSRQRVLGSNSASTRGKFRKLSIASFSFNATSPGRFVVTSGFLLLRDPAPIGIPVIPSKRDTAEDALHGTRAIER